MILILINIIILMLIFQVQSYKVIIYKYKYNNKYNNKNNNNNNRYNIKLFGTSISPSSIEVPPLVDLILLESSQVDSSKLIEAKSIVDSDQKGKERSKHVWNAKNDALVSSFQYKIQVNDDSIETMTLNERINELNTSNDGNDNKSNDAKSAEPIPVEKNYDEDGNEIVLKKRGRPRKTKTDS